ncbi:Hypothetical predicted protein [Paramuricea clavata]|uniref:Uncharacterized protein n=1 Tax=Paramuricea clavata TaxID=317549 RepID=A0A6S7KYR0_PARCT|nr:Hypothetical predicted protein [Paramuricea clavata]
MGILKVSFALLERINSGSTCQTTSGKVCAVDASCWLHNKALAVSFKDLAMIATLL